MQDGGSYRYYLGNVMHKGWLRFKNRGGERTYYLNGQGLMEMGKWLEIDGRWYYFYPDGLLARNTQIDGYAVDKQGVRKEKK